MWVKRRRGRGHRWPGLAAVLMSGMVLAACVTPQEPRAPAVSGPTTVPADPVPLQAPQAPATPTPLGVALLVPLSGPQADTGQRLVSAARTAVTRTGFRGINLTIHDTRGTPEGARAAAEAALVANADVVVGPLFSVSAQAVKPILARARVPALSFSNNRAVAGDGLYLLGHLPGHQTRVLLDHAVAQGHDRVVVVGPDTGYARLVLDAVRAHRTGAGLGRGASLIDGQLFQADLDYDGQVSLVQTLAQRNPTAVLIPTTGLGLVGLSALFAYYDATPPEVRLLGTDLWEWPGAFAEGSLHGGWYVSTHTPPTWARARASELQADANRGPLESPAAPALSTETRDESAGVTVDEPEAVDGAGGDTTTAAAATPETPAPEPLRLYSGPGKLERLAMDAIALAEAWAVKRPGIPGAAPGPDVLTRFLTDPAGYRGYSGLFRLLPSGLNERGLHVLEVSADGPQVVRPAPLAFGPRLIPARLVGPDIMARHPWLMAEYRALEPIVRPMVDGGHGVVGTPRSPDPGAARPAAHATAPAASPVERRPVTDTRCRWQGTVRVCGPTS